MNYKNKNIIIIIISKVKKNDISFHHDDCIYMCVFKDENNKY